MSRPVVLAGTDWHDQAINVIEKLARSQATVTSEDLRREFEPPEHANQIGRAFSAAGKKKIITLVDYRQSRDKSRKGGLIRVWSLHPSQGDKPDD